jgi:hypothetical protein
MTYIFKLLFFFLIIKLANLKRFKNYEETSKAINDVIQEYFIKSEISDFEILVDCNSKDEKWKIDKILNGISNNFAVETKFRKKNQGLYISKSIVGLFCSENELNIFNKNSLIKSIFHKSIKIVAFSLKVC